MKITDIQCYPVWGGGRNFLFVVVDTDEGISGVGEGGITGRELAVQGVVEHFKPLLIGQDAGRIEHLWQLMFRGGFFPAGKIACSALSAIDIALWDIKGKALGVPVYELLGGLVPRPGRLLPAHPAVAPWRTWSRTPGATSPRAGSSSAGASPTRSRGTSWSPRAAVRKAIKEFEAVREAVGDEIELCFDIHTRLDPPDAIRLCRAVEQYHPFFIEDPIRSESMQSLRVVRRARQRAPRRGRAVRRQVGVPPGDRGGADGLRPHRPLHRRRD